MQGRDRVALAANLDPIPTILPYARDLFLYWSRVHKEPSPRKETLENFLLEEPAHLFHLCGDRNVAIHLKFERSLHDCAVEVEVRFFPRTAMNRSVAVGVSEVEVPPQLFSSQVWRKQRVVAHPVLFVKFVWLGADQDKSNLSKPQPVRLEQFEAFAHRCLPL